MHYIKLCAMFLLVQSLILVAFLYIIRSHESVDNNAIVETSIVVEKIEGKQVFLIGYKTIIYSDSKKFTFIKIPILGTEEYSMHQLMETINVGDTLDIKYIEEKDHNVILDARMNGKILRSIDAYNSFLKSQQRTGIVVFIIVEILFLLVVLFCILVCLDVPKSNYRKKAKKQRMVNYHKEKINKNNK